MAGLAEVLAVKRVYEEPSDDDGVRVLVDRLWPRGITKERAALDLWLKEIAPSTPLRKELGHMRERFEDFRQRYEAELDGNAAVETLLELARGNKAGHLALWRPGPGGQSCTGAAGLPAVPGRPLSGKVTEQGRFGHDAKVVP